MRVLLTGATGLIGRRLLQRLTERCEIIALGRRPPASCSSARVEFIKHNLVYPLDFSALPARIDAVVHLAQPREYREFPDRAPEILAVNTTCTVGLLEYARRAGAERFLYASSGGIYAFQAGPVSEDAPAAPSGFYLRSKYCGEILAQAYRSYMRVILLRYFFVFGEDQRDLLVPRLIDTILAGGEVPLAGHDGIRLTPTYVDSAAAATAAALDVDLDGPLNVAGSEIWSIRQICECLAAALGSPVRFKEGALADEGNLIADTTQMTTRLGVSHRSIADALRAVAKNAGRRRQVEA